MRLKALVQCLSIAVSVVLVFSGVVSFVSTSSSAGAGSHSISCATYAEYRRRVSDSGKNVEVKQSMTSAGRLIFLKTHKTASSTLSGILWHELCDRRGLNCFLPPHANPGRTWDLVSTRDLAYIHNNVGTAGTCPPFDAWLHHARMHEAIHHVMKPTQTTEAVEFLSIVRDPAQRFRSAWTWYKLSEWFYPRRVELNLFGRSVTFGRGWKGLALEQFVDLHPISCRAEHDSAEAHTTSLSSVLYSMASWYVQYIARHVFKYRTGLDATTEELVGLRAQHPEFESRFGALLDKVLSGKVVLLVTDRFDESLLVVRRMLTLADNTRNHTATTTATVGDFMPLQQLLYLRQKQQGHTEPLSAAAVHKLHLMQPHDTVLYQAANTMLDRNIASLYGSNKSLFHSELAWLRAQLLRLEQVCTDVPADTSPRPPLSDVFVPAPRISPLGDTSAELVDLTDADLSARCESLRLDNRDLVRRAWANKLAQEEGNPLGE